MNNLSADTPRVLVSIKPLHSLIMHITEGAAQTELLLTQQQSPHHFQLRPSQQRMINRADILFYSSDNIEGFVPKLKSTNPRLQFVELSTIHNITKLHNRGLHSHDEEPKAEHGNHSDENIDGHIWLSIKNARIIGQFVAKKMIEIDPLNSSIYQNNLQSLHTQLSELNKNNSLLLDKIKDQPFLLYHDAYQYFENENKLTGAHFVTTSTEHSPGIKRIKDLKHLIDTENIQCVFYEPPNIPPLLNTLLEKKSVRLLPIDPAGTQIASGKTHYFELMSQTAKKIHGCLSTITRN